MGNTLSSYPKLSLNVISWLDCIWTTDLPSASKLIAAYLRSYMNAKHDMAWPSLKRIEQETGLGQSTICKHLEILEKNGWIKRNRGHGGAVTKSTEYIACFPSSVEQAINSIPSPPDGEPSLLDGETLSTKRRDPLHQTDTNTQVLNNQSNNQIVIPAGINLEAWEEWVSFRKSTKRSVTAKAAKKQFQLLLRYSQDQQRHIIDHSISNDYQGLFPLKGGSGDGPHQQPVKQDKSAAGRVRAAAERDRAAERTAQMAMASDDLNVRPQMGEQLRRGDRPGPSMGELFEGDYERAG